MSTRYAYAHSDVKNVSLEYLFNNKKKEIALDFHYDITYNATEWDDYKGVYH